MPLHLIKLCVGCDTVDELLAGEVRRQATANRGKCTPGKRQSVPASSSMVARSTESIAGRFCHANESWTCAPVGSGHDAIAK